VNDERDRCALVRAFLLESGWRNPTRVRFLAAGEYNENYLVDSSGELTVFRINHGTQLGLDDQIGYEFEALRQVAASGVTPIPLELCRSHPMVPRGALLMSYLPGRAFDYRDDLEGAAVCFARIHRVPYDASHGPLIVQQDPVAAIVAESRDLLDRCVQHPLPEHGRKIRAYLERINALAGTASFDNEPLCIVNTEVNSGNFVVDDGIVRLVDWEKAVASYRYQDLGHFLVPTTTLWKSDFRFDAAGRRHVLELYHEAAEPAATLDEIDERTRVLERTILLRAFSWVYMAYAEYTRGGRALSNPDTFRTIERYLNDIDLFLEP
jgi:aminoglycoside phosphotransferase (APT) family kinase protein